MCKVTDLKYALELSNQRDKFQRKMEMLKRSKRDSYTGIFIGGVDIETSNLSEAMYDNIVGLLLKEMEGHIQDIEKQLTNLAVVL